MRGQVALIFVLAFLAIAQCALMNYRLPARRSGSHVKHRHHLPGAQEIRKQFLEKTMEAEWYRRTSWFFNELLKKYKTKNDELLSEEIRFYQNIFVFDREKKLDAVLKLEFCCY